MEIINSKIKRQFISGNLKIKEWSDLAPFFLNLENREITNKSDLEKWLTDKSELDAILEEELAWRYIKSNCDTTNKELTNNLEYFIENIDPEIAKKSNVLDKKLSNCEFFNDLDERFLIVKRELKNKLELYREENVAIFSELQKEEQEYGAIAAQMTIVYKGETLTLHKATNFLKDTNREVRAEVYNLINNRRLQDSDALNNLLSKLIEKRNKISINAGFTNYRDYMHKALNRFDYSVFDVINFQNTIQKTVTPIIEKIHKKRLGKLKYENLKPYDLDVDIDLKQPLKPFETALELTDKTIEIFGKLNPKFGNFIYTMKQLGYLDLDAREGKAPGGFNYPLYESNVPFIFTNATGNLRDVETMMHEGGHAVHSFLSKDLNLIEFKNLPSEVAELASMSMELISMEYWNVFFNNEEDLKRAKLSQLEGVISVLPWVATVDKFQHWLYLNPNHTVEERNAEWTKIFNEFGSSVIDWSEFEHFKSNSWQKQLHIFEVPFYYIEYAISQLGAIAIWRNFKQNKQSALKNYENALKLGYSVTIPEIYKTAGIEFNFSEKYIKELMQFVETEIEKL
jgi:oligoendopeptidase F